MRTDRAYRLEIQKTKGDRLLAAKSDRNNGNAGKKEGVGQNSPENRGKLILLSILVIAVSFVVLFISASNKTGTETEVSGEGKLIEAAENAAETAENKPGPTADIVAVLPEETETPAPEITPFENEQVRTPLPVTTSAPSGKQERYARIIDPDSIDYSFLESVPAGYFEDSNQSSGQWSCGQWYFDSNGVLKASHDKRQTTLDFLKAHHSFDRLPTTENKIMLALVSGYYNQYVKQASEIIRAKGVKCVYFFTGDALRNAPAGFIQGLIDDGSVIGSHSMMHPSLPHITYREIVEDANAFHSLLNSVLGYDYKLKYYMPPGGGATKRDVALLEFLGYTTTYWTFTYRDYGTVEMTREEGFECLKRSVFPGCVVYIHGTSEFTVSLLEQYIDYVHDQGFEFVLPGRYFD